MLRICLLGQFEVTADGLPVAIASRPAQSLLAYLVLNPNTVHRREKLAGLLWPEATEANARNNLRQALYRLRKALETDAPGSPTYFVVDDIAISFDGHVPMSVDVTQLEAKGKANPTDDELVEAVSAYRAELLPGFYDDWVVLERERLQAVFERQTGRLLERLTEVQRWSDVLDWGERWIALGGAPEPAYRALMTAHAHLSDFSRVAAVYQRCVDDLHREMNVEPSEQTRALFERLTTGARTTTTVLTPSHPIRGYQLRERLGSGGFGVVHRAYQPGVGREVAIKIILPQHANHPDFIRRFEAEAQLVARLEHLHIVPLYDYWREPDGAYLVMRWLKGGSLRAALDAKGPWPLTAVARLLDQIAGALNAAHRQGVVHRDIKPDNIMLDEEGNAYLSDFGIAKDLQEPHPAYDTIAISRTDVYVAPESLQHQNQTAQSDLYSLAVVIYELLYGEPPALGPVAPGQLTPVMALRERRPEVPASVEIILRRALAPRAAERYNDVLAFATEFRAATSATPAALTFGRDLINPYKGLRAFDEADAADYFGRAALIERLLGSLARPRPDAPHATRFLAVVGPSGSGKSSVVRAGLLPAVRRGALPGSDQWYFADILPGAHPFEEVEIALLRLAAHAPANLMEQLRRDERGLLRATRLALPDDGAHLLLVIDQFEEIFTLVNDKSESQRFLDCLLAAITDPRSPVTVVITLRADFYDRPLSVPGLGELMRQHTEVVLPLDVDELWQAISEPAKRAGAELEIGLVTTIVADVNEQPGALPLLQYALTELFDYALTEANDTPPLVLTKAAYHAIGGVTGALARRAEEVYAGLPDVQQAAARQLFLRLVKLGEGTEDTRRRVGRSELESLSGPSVMSPVIEAFGTSRLLAFDRDPLTRAPTVEVAHEALLYEWQRLHEWLETSRTDVRQQRQLAVAATEWMASSREPGYLLSGSRLAAFEGWMSQTQVALTPEERAFLEGSVAERDQRFAAEQERQQRELAAARQSAEMAQQLAATEKRRAEDNRRSATRLRVGTILLGVAFVIAVMLAFLSRNLATQSVANAHTAQAASTAAFANATDAVANANDAQTAEANARDQQATAQAASTVAVAEAQSRATQQALAEENFMHAEAQRLAAEANRLVQLKGNAELIALLSLRSINTQYTRQGDEALTLAAALDYPFRRFVGHTAGVSSAAFSPDGKRLLTGSFDLTARLWDVDTGQPLAVFSDTDKVTCVAFSPDGRWIAAGSEDSSVRVWDAQTGREQHTLTGHTGHVRAIAYSPDGRWILTSADDYSARLWDAQTGAETRVFTHTANAITAVAFSPDGQFILTGAEDALARLWDLNSGQVIREFKGHTDRVLSVAFSPDGKYVLTGGYDNLAILWDAQTGAEVRQFAGHTAGIISAVFSPDGRFILTGSYDHTARLWEAETGALVRALTAHIAAVTQVAFAPDGQSFVTLGNGYMAQLWATAGTNLLRQFHGHSGAINSVAFTPDGRAALTGSQDKTARLWEVQTGALLQEFVGHTDLINSVAVSHDGRYVLTGSWDSTARLWDARTGAELRRFTQKQGIIAVAFSSDDKQVLTGGWDSTAWLWDTATGGALQQFVGHTNLIYGVAFSPDDRYVLTASFDGTARLWEAQTGQEVRAFDNHASEVTSVSFSPDGRYILTGSYDHTAALWETQTGREVRRFVGHGDVIWGVAFSPDGRYVLTGGSDNTARLWETDTGIEIRTIIGHTAAIESVAFSPDGQYILTGSDDLTARLTWTNYRDLAQALCARLQRDLSAEERAQFNLADDAPTCPSP